MGVWPGQDIIDYALFEQGIKNIVILKVIDIFQIFYIIFSETLNRCEQVTEKAEVVDVDVCSKNGLNMLNLNNK